MLHLTLQCSSHHAAAFFDTYKHGFYKINTLGEMDWKCMRLLGSIIAVRAVDLSQNYEMM